MVELEAFIPVLKDVLLVVATILATTFAQSKISGRSERKKLYNGFLQEIRQNTYLAKHNSQQDVGVAKFLRFRNDFWEISKASGHFLDLSSDLQTLLYETCMKQDEVNCQIDNLEHVLLNTIKESIKEELRPKLDQVEKLLSKKV